MIVFAGIVPHPPLLIPEIGKSDTEKVRATQNAMEMFSKKLVESEPDTIIMISPHMVHYPHMYNVCGMESLAGNFENFNEEAYQWEGKNNLELASEIVDKSEAEGLPAIFYDNGDSKYTVDHGVMVPLYFFEKELDFPAKILPLGYSIAGRAEHYAFGQVIGSICAKKSTERIAIIASGDLSHRLQHKMGEDQKNTGAEFDKTLTNLITCGDDFSILNLDEDLVENAGECGYKSILVLLGALSGRDYKPEVYSYEGPFGVGYMVANLNIDS